MNEKERKKDCKSERERERERVKQVIVFIRESLIRLSGEIQLPNRCALLNGALMIHLVVVRLRGQLRAHVTPDWHEAH